MSNYPGNPSLSNAVKERVLSTFQQTLALYKQGRSDEAVQGCGLILRMDPAFEPAKKLMEKARNPNAPIDVDQLAAAGASGPSIADARAAMAARNFQKAIDITTEILTNDLMNEEARLLNEQAREKAEASPFIDQFVKKADQAIASGNIAAARAAMEKIKSLDADDTAIVRMEQAIEKMAQPASPSFVVDTPKAPAGRGTAQASDFGFTFEEDKPKESALSSFSFDSPFSTDTGTTSPITPPSGFSFDSTAPKPAEAAPPAAAPAGGGFSFDTPVPSPSPFATGFSFDAPAPAAPAAGTAGEFDFATASIEPTPDDQKKVQEYLAEGDRAAAAGDVQKAIDVWSRVFLIDVTNEQASDRIEKAKAQRRAAEQTIEPLLASAVEAFEAGDRKSAREKFAKVQQLDPGNQSAKDYLSRLAEVGTEGGAAGFEAPFTPPPPAAAPDIFADESPASSSSLVPPSPAAAAPASAVPAARKPAAKAKPAAAAPAPRELPIKAIGVVAAVVILGAIGWFGWSKFMNRPSYDPAATQAIFKQATTLASKGEYDSAITLLQDVKVADPQHDKALSMIADLQHKKVQASENAVGRSSNVAWQQAIAAGRTAYESHDYDAAKKSFDSAAAMKPLPADVQSIYNNVSQQVSKLEGAKQLFSEQRYQDALTSLQSLEQQDPQNQSVKRLITDAHFNLGALALQAEQMPDAIQQFDEVLKGDPNDELAKRSKSLAERYNGQPKDLLYKIYVKYLPMRKVS